MRDRDTRLINPPTAAPIRQRRSAITDIVAARVNFPSAASRGEAAAPPPAVARLAPPCRWATCRCFPFLAFRFLHATVAERQALRAATVDCRTSRRDVSGREFGLAITPKRTVVSVRRGYCTDWRLFETSDRRLDYFAFMFSCKCWDILLIGNLSGHCFTSGLSAKVIGVCGRSSFFGLREKLKVIFVESCG